MKIVTSNSSHDAYFRVLEEMKRAKAGGGRIVIIAPDRFTASVERGLLLTLGEEGSFDMEVMSFTRMADRYVGADIKKCLTPEGSVMLIARVIDECVARGELGYYGKAAGREGFAAELYAALTAIRNSGISTDRLDEAARAAKSNSLKRKLTDIVTIFRGYLAALEGRHSDSTTRLEQLAKYIRSDPSAFAATHYFCTDINEFSAPEYAVLAELARHAGSLTVGIESGRGNLNCRIYPDRVIDRLTALCPDKVERLDYKDEGMHPALKLISETLFSYQPPEAPEQSDGMIRLRYAKDRSEEVLRLALDVMAHVRSGGRYKDFEVYASDIDDYEQEIKSVFGRYGIPFFIDKRALLVEQTKARYLLDAIACVRSGFATDEVLAFVKNPLFTSVVEGGENSVFKFENFLLEISAKRCRKNEKFQKSENKRQFIQQKSQDKVPNVQFFAPEAVREKLFDALSPFVLATETEGATYADFVLAARTFLQSCDEASKSYVDKLAALSSYYARCAEQVDSKLNSVLDEIASVLDGGTDIAGFEGVLKSMVKTLKISLVPTYLDCVFVGDGDSRFMGDGKIYVIGATNDKFPSASSGGVVLNQRDEQLMKGLGVPIVPDLGEKAYAEMFKVLELIKKPRKGVVISYPESGGTSMLRRSTVIDELCGLLEEDGKPLKAERIDFLRPRELDEDDKIDLLLTERGAGYLAMSSFGRSGVDEVLGTAYECMDDGLKPRIDPNALPPERIAMPTGSFNGTINVSRLETFYSCPYRHYMQYVLSLKQRREGELQGTENGTLLHAVLEKLFKALRDGAITDEAEIGVAAERYFDEAVEENGFEELFNDARTARILLRTKAEARELCLQLYKIYLRSDFKPILLEARISDIADVKPEAEGEQFQLRGVIDRVDAYDGKFIVIDYKTFKSADVAPKDVYVGKKLQLYVYMNAVESGTGMTPAGVFYLPIYSKYGSEDVTRLEYKGQATDDAETLRHIDGNFGLQGATISLSTDKRGNIKKDRHLSAREFEILGNYAKALAGKGAREIERGYIKPVPIDKCNDFCDFYDICAFRTETDLRRPAVPDVGRFLENAGDDGKEE